MTSTDKPFVMPATQLAYSIKTLSESVILHLKAHKHFSEQDLDQLAEQLIAKLVVFINKHHSQTVTVEPLGDAGILRTKSLGSNGYSQTELLSMLASGSLILSVPGITVTSNNVTVTVTPPIK